MPKAPRWTRARRPSTGPRREAAPEIGGHGADIAGAHRQYHVAVVQHLAQRLCQILDALHEHGLDPPARPHHPADGTAVGSRDGGLPGGIHLRHQQHVAHAQGAPEIVEQIPGAGESVRLKYQHQAAPRPCLPHRFHRCLDFGRMVPVVVDDVRRAAGPMDLAQLLQAPVDALKIRERALDGRVRDAELRRHGHGGQRVQHVVPARQIDGEGQRRSPVAQRGEMRLEARAFHLDRADVHPLVESIGDDGPRNVPEDAPNLRVVRAQHGKAVKWQVVQEIDEALLEPREISLVRAEMIVVDVRDDRDHGLQMHERGIALVGFRDEVAPRAQTRIAVRALQPSADDERRVEAAFGEDARHEARGGGLAVSPRDRHRVSEAHQLAEHFRSRNHRDAVRERRGDFRILAVDGARHHHDIRLSEILRGMARENPGAEAREPLGHGVRLQVRALYLVAEIEQHFGDAAHAGAADADQVNQMNAAHAVVHAETPPAARHRSASRVAASTLRTARAASAILSIRGRSWVSSAMPALKLSAVRSRS